MLQNVQKRPSVAGRPHQAVIQLWEKFCQRPGIQFARTTNHRDKDEVAFEATWVGWVDLTSFLSPVAQAHDLCNIFWDPRESDRGPRPKVTGQSDRAPWVRRAVGTADG